MTDKPQFEPLPEGLLVRAPAKLNLSLLIAGRRPDGFHDLETIMAKIDWHDTILIRPGRQAGVQLVCDGPCWAPEGRDNLVFQAAQDILRTCNRQDNLHITLTKNIPAGTGLGSASSDAAATLLGVDKFLDLQLPGERMTSLAAQLGSDVAFFLNGPLAFCSGRGERSRKLDTIFHFTAMVFLPNVSISTRDVYEQYKHDAALYDRLSRPILDAIEKNRIDLAAEMCTNMLERSCFGRFEELGELKDAIESLGIQRVCLSGSGSAMFSIVDEQDIEHVTRLQDRVARKTGCRSIVVRNNLW